MAVNQTNYNNWMPRPAPNADCPPGFEYLLDLDRIQIEQVANIIEVFTSWVCNNRYMIRNQLGQQLYFAAEESDALMRYFCQGSRGFTIHIIDNNNRVIMDISREFNCCSGCCWFIGCCSSCAYVVKVALPDGTPIGFVRQKASKWKDYYDILDESGQTILTIRGPCCIWDGLCCPCDSSFRIIGSDGQTEVGSVTKHYAGVIRESFTSADRFSITFPADLSVRVKATLMAALFLIDFMHFEYKEEDQNQVF